MKVIVIKGAASEREFRLHDGTNTIGRGITNRIRLLDPRVSRRHCKIRKIGLSLFLSDMGTKNGTQVNGKTVLDQELKVFDEIRIGKTILKIVREDHPPQLTKNLGPRSLIDSLVGFLFRNSQNGGEPVVDEFAKFARKRRKSLWRPHTDTEPPEGHSETVVSTTDPDSSSNCP
jgi:pSer/pThr/pTyr-binding forkhead associated (FHA) protein